MKRLVGTQEIQIYTMTDKYELLPVSDNIWMFCSCSLAHYVTITLNLILQDSSDSTDSTTESSVEVEVEEAGRTKGQWHCDVFILSALDTLVIFIGLVLSCVKFAQLSVRSLSCLN